MHPTHTPTPPTPAPPAGDELDCFGAHVGLPLHHLHMLRAIRQELESDSGHSVSLTDAFCHVIHTAYTVLLATRERRFAKMLVDQVAKGRSSKGGDTPSAEGWAEPM